MFHICLELTEKDLKAKGRSANRIHGPIPLTPNCLKQSLVLLLCANPELRVFVAYWQVFLICYTEIRIGFHCRVYGEEAELNTHTQNDVCVFI